MAKTSETAAVTIGGPLRVDTISLKACNIDGGVSVATNEKGEAIHPDGSKVFLARIIGVATGIKEVRNRSTGDTMNQLKGDFECFNAVTGENFFSALCYLLTGGTQDVVEGPIDEAEIAGQPASVPFAVDYYAVPNLRPAQGNRAAKRYYDLRAEYVEAPERRDLLGSLRAKLPPLPVAPPVTPGTTGDGAGA